MSTSTNTVQLPPAELRLCDENFEQSIVLTQYDSFTYTEVWGGADSFSITMSRSAQYADEVLTGRIIMVPSDQTHDYYRVLIIRQIKVDEDSIRASGTDYLWDLMGARLCNYGTDTGTGYDKQTGNAETVARHYLTENCLGAAVEKRKDPFVVLEAERTTPLGKDVEIEARLQSVANIMESICTQGEINLYGALMETTDTTTYPWGWYIEARFAVGTDHSQDDDNTNTWVVLSEEYGNALLTSFVDNVPTATVVDVYGSGSGSSRPHTEVGDQTLTGASRREMYLDASDCSDEDSRIARGNEALADAKKQSVELKLVDLDAYNRDFTLGDTVTCDAGIYGAYNLPVTEVETEYSAESTEISVVLGAEITGVMTVLRSAIESIPLRRQ